MKKVFMVICLVMVCSFYSCSSGNKEWIEERAVDKWQKQGFEVVDYEGFEWGWWGLTSYGGAKVWYRLKKIPDNGITYSGYLSRWGNELQVYGPKACDTIQPNN